MGKLRPAGHIRPVRLFNPARRTCPNRDFVYFRCALARKVLVTQNPSPWFVNPFVCQHFAKKNNQWTLSKSQRTRPPHRWGSFRNSRSDFGEQRGAWRGCRATRRNTQPEESHLDRVRVFSLYYTLRVTVSVPVSVTCARCWLVLYFTERIHQRLQRSLQLHLPGQQRGLVTRWHDVIIVKPYCK